MGTITLEGYHATASNNVKTIISEGFVESKTNSEHWLGRGVYFFEDLYYAVEWEIIGVLKQRNIEDEKELKETDILLAKINCKDYEMVDLSTPYGCDIFNSLLDVIKYNYSSEEYEKILNKGDKYIIKVLENLEKTKREKYLSAFDIVCADYHKPIYKKIMKERKFYFLY